MNEVKNNSPKRPVIFYYAIALGRSVGSELSAGALDE